MLEHSDMVMDRTDKSVLLVTCSCGGWVMVASLSHADKRTFREAADMAAEGFAVRTPVPFSEYLETPACEHRGRCLTDPTSISDPTQQELAI